MPKKKNDKNKPRLTEAQLKTCEDLASVGVPLDIIARKMNMSPATLDRWIVDFPEINEAISRGRDNAQIHARKILYGEAFIKKNVPLMIFYAKTQLGFKESKQEIEITTKTPSLHFNFGKGKASVEQVEEAFERYVDKPVKPDESA